ncbi:hypothetical protein [Pseudomonas donghuensis]|uniref:hypothetical protein n=1 Tax=Pseudomonas donghuensis TaxID=1163398 RepID=UPI00215FF611|nr:hypothetical protein [Pseudomonas donghuensis]UVL22400.1 hypothetical protein LOY30_16190 [Pseudomonas donghuensis]
MPAPDTLNVHTPGETIVQPTTTPVATTSTEQQASIPVYIAKHNGGGRWKIWHTPAEGVPDWFSDFVATGQGAKDQAEVEAQRLNDGGEPLIIDATRASELAALEQPKPTAAPAVDATSLKQAVMTSDGWLCPEPAAKE